MSIQDLKVQLTNYWYDKTVLQYLIGVLVVLIVVMLIAVYYTYHYNWLLVSILILLGLVACLILTIQQYQKIQKT